MILVSSFLILAPLQADEEPAAIFGAAWELDRGIDISSQSLTTLRRRFPAIQGPQDLSQILVSTSYKSPSAALRIEWDGTKWVVIGRPAPTVTSIDFSLAPLALLPALRTATSNWIGQVHTEELKSKVENDITAYLRKSGYRSAQTAVTTNESKNQIEYKATLNIGSPCIIKGYLWPDKLPTVRLPLLDNGEICDESLAATSLDEIEQRLHENGWVQASLDFDGFLADDTQNIAYVKVAGSIGEKISYEFIDPTTSNDVSSLLTSGELNLLEPSTTGPDAVAYEVSHQLKNRGYSDAVVTGPEIVRTTPGVARYIFGISRGELYRVSSIQFEGNDFLTNNELISAIKIDTTPTGGDQPKSPPYSPEAVEAGTEAIKNQYIEEGFWDAKVSERTLQSTNSDRHQVQIVVSVEEGQRRLFDRVEIVGAKQIPTEDLTGLWTTEKGEAFNRADILTFQQKVRTEYASRGYFYTTVGVELVSEPKNNQEVFVTAKTTVDEGPRIRFGDIFISGLVKTDPQVVSREVLFETGDWYDPELESASTKALLRLGIFSSVIIRRIEPVAPSSRSEMMDIIIDVKEGPSRTVSFGPGWSSFYGMRYNVEGGLTNLGGTGRQIFSRASFNQEKSQYAIGPRTLVGRTISAGYLEPHLFGTPINGTVSLSQEARAIDYAWSLTRGGEIELSHTLRTLVPGSKIATFYGRKLSEEESKKVTRDAFLADTYSSGRVGLRFNIDHRNDLSWPTSGYTINSELAWARYELGGDLRYYRWEVGNNHYFSIFDDLVFAIGANFSAYQEVKRRNPTSGDILPATERLSAGGTDSVRGFPKKLGPVVRAPKVNSEGEWEETCGYVSTPTGGTRRTILKAELRYRWTESVATTTFIDSGNTSFSREEIAKFNEAFKTARPVETNKCADKSPTLRILDNMDYDVADLPGNPNYIWERHFTSLGAALNFLTPIGSINLAYGVPWHEPKSQECKDNEDLCFSRAHQTDKWWRKGEFHFNVGAKF